MKVCQTTVHVNDIDKAIEFYQGKLGFEVLNRDGYPYVVVLKHEGFPIVLHKVDRRVDVDYASANHIVLAFQTNNIAETFANLKSKGVEFIHGEPQSFPVGRMAAFRDPAGNIHEIIEYQFPN